MEGRVPSRAACFVLMPLVEMELDLPEGRRFARAQCLWSGADCGVLEGRVPSRPACSVLMAMVEMELDLPWEPRLLRLGAFDRARIGVLEGRVPSRPALYLLAHMLVPMLRHPNLGLAKFHECRIPFRH